MLFPRYGLYCITATTIRYEFQNYIQLRTCIYNMYETYGYEFRISFDSLDVSEIKKVEIQLILKTKRSSLIGN